MFCGNCGTHNNESSAFCANCGAPLTLETPAPQAPAPKRSKKGLIIGLSIGAAVLAILAVVLILTLGGGKKSSSRSPEDVAEQYLNAQLNVDFASIVELMPDALVKKEFSEGSYTTEDMANDKNKTLNRLFKEMDETFSQWSIDCESCTVTDMYTPELERLQELYQSKYGCEITDGKRVTLALVVTLDGEQETHELWIHVIQIDNEWYLETYHLNELRHVLMNILDY